MLSGTHGGILNHVNKSLYKCGRVKYIDMSKIMKRRVAATLVRLEAMKELEYWTDFFYTWFRRCSS